MNPHKVRAILECRRCGHQMNMCVQVRRGVPDFLRCDHDQHGGVPKDGAGDIVCPQCGCLWRIGGEDLTHRIEGLMSANMSEWKRRRGVVLGCG